MSKKVEVQATAKVNDQGVMRVVNRKLFDESLKQFAKEGKETEVEIFIRKKRRTVSNPLRRYYFGVVVRMVRAGLVDMGMKLDLKAADEWVRDLILSANPETVHDFLKQRFIEAVTVDEETGEFIKNDMSTKRMTNTEFMEFYSPVYKWAAEFLGIVIPDPDPEYNIPKDLFDEENQKLL